MGSSSFPHRGTGRVRVRLIVSGFVVALLVVVASSSAASSPRTSFSTPQVIGFAKGDDWEPDVAADGRGNVYVAWAHFGEVPSCDVCGSPVAMVQASHDGGRIFGAPEVLNP